MKRLINRFWDWIFHPSIRRQNTTRGKTYMYRYPSPGSYVQGNKTPDYRQPYYTSQHNIRYSALTQDQKKEGQSYLSIQPFNVDSIKKLVYLGYLNKANIGNQQAIEDAKKRYEVDHKQPVEQHIHHNDFGMQMPNMKDPQSIRETLQMELAIRRICNEHLRENNVDDMGRVQIESLDMFTSPQLMQNRIQADYFFDQVVDNRIEEGKLQMKKGEANFWKALDDSNDPENVKKVQQKIGDTDPNNFKLRTDHMLFDFDDEKNVIDLERKK